MKRTLSTVTAFVMSFQLFLFTAYANNTTGNEPVTDIDGVQGDLLVWVQYVLNLIIGLTGLIAVGVLIYSGILYIVSAGDEGKVESATKGITYAVIGLILCFIAVLVVNWVLGTVLAGGGTTNS